MSEQKPNPFAGPARGRPHRTASSLVFQAIVLGLVWILFSGKLDALHLGYGIVSVAIVLFATRHLSVDAGVVDRDAPLATPTPADAPRRRRVHWGRAVVYPFWLFGQIVVSNLQVARIILHPRPHLDPVLLRFRSRLRTPLSKVVLGNSITLTPGTFTLRIRGDEFLVHAIAEGMTSGLIVGTMQRKVAAVFGEEEFERPPAQGTRDPEAVEKGWEE